MFIFLIICCAENPQESRSCDIWVPFDDWKWSRNKNDPLLFWRLVMVAKQKWSPPSFLLENDPLLLLFWFLKSLIFVFVFCVFCFVCVGFLIESCRGAEQPGCERPLLVRGRDGHARCPRRALQAEADLQLPCPLLPSKVSTQGCVTWLDKGKYYVDSSL